MDTKFGTNVSNRTLLNSAKFQGYSFYRFELLRENQMEGGQGKITVPPPPPRLRLNYQLNLITDYVKFKFINTPT